MTEQAREGEEGEETKEGREDGRNDASELLELIGKLVRETRGEMEAGIGLDASLEADLGFDSLSRSELLGRVEQHFDVDLPDSALASETPADLLELVLESSGRSVQVRDLRYDTPEPIEGEPQDAETLVDVLEWHARRHGERTHLHVYEDAGSEFTLSYQQVANSALSVAAFLIEQGLQSQQCVALMLPTGRDYFYSFLGILLAGGVPVPIYPPVRPAQLEEHLKRHAGILDNARVFALITVPEAKTVARMLERRVKTLRHILLADEMLDAGGAADLPEVKTGDTAFIQYTSGTTGDPKGVVLSHAKLLANVRCMGKRVEARSDDVFVSWLPLYHDMGLIGAWFGTLYYGCPLVVMSPMRFLARPVRWLEAVHRHRGTLSGAPNFGYELCLRRIGDEELEGLDLGSWRFAFNGAEPVSPATLERFTERFSAAGFDRNALTPVYGLAESCVGLTLPSPGQGARIDTIDRDTFTETGRAEPTSSEDGQRFVGCGHVLEDHEIRIVDRDGRELPDRSEGTLQFRGPSATEGYLRNEEATQGLIKENGWLDSGDRAYLSDGELFITGRNKDLIIRSGRNIHPQEIEEAVGAIDGIRQGCVAVFGVRAPDQEGERLIVVAEYRDASGDRDALRDKVREVTGSCAMLPPDDVCIVPPRSVLKTSSGKIRRAATAQRYQRGTLGKGTGTSWWQWVRLALNATGATLRHLPERMPGYLYAAYAWLVFAFMAPLLWVGTLLIPGLANRWRWARACVRISLAVTFMRLQVQGTEQLPGDAFVMVANHSSYLDGFILCVAVPRDLRFVAKRELRRQFLARTLLQRLDVQFVERFRVEEGAKETPAAVEAARAGKLPTFFPEGTFQRRPGLMPFRMGAFVTAAQAGAAVVPVVISGTRRALPADTWALRRGHFTVQICEAIEPGGDKWEDAVALRNSAREAMLARIDEPDLGQR